MNKFIIFKYVLCFTLIFILSIACSKAKFKSRVQYFEYQGYGDTTVAMLFGNIKEMNPNYTSSYVPVKGAKIIIIKDSQEIFSDINGNFLVGLTNGEYDIFITKPGYQSLKLEHYKCISDRVSVTNIILNKGEGGINYKIKETKSIK